MVGDSDSAVAFLYDCSLVVPIASMPDKLCRAFAVRNKTYARTSRSDLVLAPNRPHRALPPRREALVTFPAPTLAGLRDPNTSEDSRSPGDQPRRQEQRERRAVVRFSAWRFDAADRILQNIRVRVFSTADF